MDRFKYLMPLFPLIQMIRVQATYGLMSWRKWKVFLIWFTKLIILEPFRLLEAAVMIILPERRPRIIFITGFYRSGTTYLQELMAADRNHKTLTLFGSVMPEVSLCFSWLFVPILTLVTKMFKVQNPFHKMGFSWTFPGEDDVALNAMMAFHDYNRIYQYPSHYDLLTRRYIEFDKQQDSQRWQMAHKYFTKKLAYRYWNKTLILKSPPNTARIGLLKETYPDAKFIFIHRDPLDSVHSAKRIWKLNRAFAFEEYTETVVEHILVDQYCRFYERYKAQNGEQICARVRFDDLVRDAAFELKRLHKELHIGGWKEAKSAICKIEIERDKKVPAEKKSRHCIYAKALAYKESEVNWVIKISPDI